MLWAPVWRPTYDLHMPFHVCLGICSSRLIFSALSNGDSIGIENLFTALVGVQSLGPCIEGPKLGAHTWTATRAPFLMLSNRRDNTPTQGPPGRTKVSPPSKKVPKFGHPNLAPEFVRLEVSPRVAFTVSTCVHGPKPQTLNPKPWVTRAFTFSTQGDSGAFFPDLTVSPA